MPYKKLDFKEEKEKYDAFEEIAEINMRKCDHSKVQIIGNELRCSCGAAWSGARIHELYKLLTQNGRKE